MSNAACVQSDDVAVDPWIYQGGYLLLIAGVIEVFWAMAFICEEYCVPAITVFCKRYKIPDDIAGAIFIGTGLSLPVLFASFVGLFVSNTSIGVGTVVGGNIFNHLINIAVSIYVAPNKTLVLDGLVFTREMIFYFLSCLLVIYSLQGDISYSLSNTFNKDQWYSCLSITWFAAFILVMNYVLYCVIDSYFQDVVKYVIRCYEKYFKFWDRVSFLSMSSDDSNSSSPRPEAAILSIEAIYGSSSSSNSDLEQQRRLQQQGNGAATRQRRHTPNTNNNTNTTSYTRSSTSLNNAAHRVYEDITTAQCIYEEEDVGETTQCLSTTLDDHPHHHSSFAPTSSTHIASIPPLLLHPPSSSSTSTSHHQDTALSMSEIGLTETALQLHNTQTTHATTSSSVGASSLSIPAAPHQHTEEELLLTDFPMYIRSNFYYNHDFGGCIPTSRKWKLRHFEFTPQYGLCYKLAYHLPMRGIHIRFIDLFDMEEYEILDERNYEFSIKLRNKQKTYCFRAPNDRIFQVLIAKLRNWLQDIKVRSESELRAMAIKSMHEIITTDDAEMLLDPDRESVGDTGFVIPASWPMRIFYYFTWPMKIAIYLTIPDVRKDGYDGWAVPAIGIGFAWLGILTYILVDALSILAYLMNINATIMGLTIGAWATSYPAVWSSVVVARNGFGDMAVCNALGSIIFSNYLGLGLPWLIYIIVYGKSYDAIEDQGVVLSILVLMMILIGTYIMIACAKFTLKAWMVPVMTLVYIAYILYFVYFNLTF